MLEVRGARPEQLVGLPALRGSLEVISIEGSLMTSPAQLLLTDYVGYWRARSQRPESVAGMVERSGETSCIRQLCDDNRTSWSRLSTLRATRCGMTTLEPLTSGPITVTISPLMW